MRVGVSTACLFPCETVQALDRLVECNVPVVEIFFNSFDEMRPDYVRRLKEIVFRSGVKITALHPCTSFMESFFFASDYPTRFEEGIRLYRRWFEICAEMDIPRVVFHGDNLRTPFPFEKHCRNYLSLRRAAREYGVEFCQENVVRCKCGFPDAIRRMRDVLDDDVSFVLDIKQMRRAGVGTHEMLDAMRGKIAYLHLSDCTEESDCTPPGTGMFPFSELFRLLDTDGFCGDMVIELYRNSFGSPEELERSRRWIERCYAERYNKR